MSNRLGGDGTIVGSRSRLRSALMLFIGNGRFHKRDHGGQVLSVVSSWLSGVWRALVNCYICCWRMRWEILACLFFLLQTCSDRRLFVGKLYMSLYPHCILVTQIQSLLV